ncbi:hypothetical protein RhiirA1_479440 [Rhizophagus irregularis]|uniref:Uncharacterized protein n=1 Tax=Rhizophagus irregularis TaxID=588596 RepID=A0A2N0QQM9_9GLOM|nr:hypothetical protein RhiirA1_479440 [Rhizophagus irregularis]
MSGNYAKRGRGSYNPNSRKAVRHDKKHTKDSDNSSSDGENTIQQKRNYTVTENSIDEDYVADAQTADVGKMTSNNPLTRHPIWKPMVLPLAIETYESYTGKARMTGSGNAKRLVIHFSTAEA